jgi:hypothetical protein
MKKPGLRRNTGTAFPFTGGCVPRTGQGTSASAAIPKEGAGATRREALPSPSQTLQSPLLGVPLLAPHLHRRFFVIAPLLEFAEKAVLLELPFEDLKGFLQVSVVYPYLQKL